MGQSPSSKNYTDNPNDNILVQGNADLKDGKVIPRLWTKEITKTIDKDGIILTVRAPVGDVAKTDYKVVLGRGVAGIKGNDFIYQFLQKLQYNRHWVSLSSGSTFESINSNDIKDLIIDIPSIEEQNKISMLLNNVNSIITLHQRKLEKLKLTKKALLQKLFPQNGSKLPELRFKGFTDAWEQRKFKDIAFKRGKISEADLPYIEFEDINSGIGTLNKNILQKVGHKKGILFEAGDVLFGKLRPYLQNWLLCQFMGIAVGDFWVFQPQIVSSAFLYYLIQSEAYQSVANISSGTKMPRSSWSLVSESRFSIPKYKEATMIGEFFTSIDKNITLHHRKLEMLKNVKKGLLQKMFV